MNRIKYLVILLLFSIIFVSCNNENKADNITASSESLVSNSKNTISSNELKVKNAFALNGKFEDDAFRFRKYNFSETNKESTLFGFIYSPSEDLFLCSFASFDRDSSENTSNHGSVSFRWGKFRTGYFYGTHYFNDTDKIDFAFSGFQFVNNNIGSQYKYSVVENTYTKSLSQKDIDRYAALCYKCIQNSIIFAQSIISTYCGDVLLLEG